MSAQAKQQCGCGEWISYSNWQRHQDGKEHQLKMAMSRARARGHTYFVSDELALSMMRLGLSQHFTQVRTERHGETVKDRHWMTSPEVIQVLSRFSSRRDDHPDSTFHAALVFASVYGDETPKILIGMIDAEIQAGQISTHNGGKAVATRESALVALLRANGVARPALSLTNLMPHLLAIALAKLEPDRCHVET
jgi:hypothetical protein